MSHTNDGLSRDLYTPNITCGHFRKWVGADEYDAIVGFVGPWPLAYEAWSVIEKRLVTGLVKMIDDCRQTIPEKRLLWLEPYHPHPFGNKSLLESGVWSHLGRWPAVWRLREALRSALGPLLPMLPTFDLSMNQEGAKDVVHPSGQVYLTVIRLITTILWDGV